MDPVTRPDPVPEWSGRPWFGLPVRVVADTDEHLVTYIPSGTPFGFVDGPWPTPDGTHPWHERDRWHGHGCLMVQRPGDHHAVWHFWEGRDRRFSCWYVNLQVAHRRTAIGFDTQDLELDIVVHPDGSWAFKDADVLGARVADGRFPTSFVGWVTGLGDELGVELDAGRRWWDPVWAEWTPDPAWDTPALRPDWADDLVP